MSTPSASNLLVNMTNTSYRLKIWTLYLYLPQCLLECIILMSYIFFQGVTYPSTQVLLSSWAPPLERSKLTTIAIAGMIQ